jgi:hypothetical protein
LDVDVSTRILLEDLYSAGFLIATPRSHPQQQPAPIEMSLDAHRVAVADQLRQPGTEETGSAAEGRGRSELCKASARRSDRPHQNPRGHIHKCGNDRTLAIADGFG